MYCKVIEISIIIPTLNREKVLRTTINSIANQDTQPFEIIIIDGSVNFNKINQSDFKNLASNIIHQKATELGAAKQRNQGIALTNTNVIGFFDDDIILEKDCIKNLWEGIQKHPNCGGVNALITNQLYHPLGKLSRIFYRIMGADTSRSLAGKCIGPAINFLPEIDTKQDFVPVDWLNTTCTLYRKEALPSPVFDTHFTGYSLMEDLALSLGVGKNWLLLNASKARIYHDSQPSEGKNNLYMNAEMDLVNRFYIMKNIMKQHNLTDYSKLFLQQLFVSVASKNIFSVSFMKGKISGLKKLRQI
ncbi:MAG: glycosyltransferase family A protein [Heyndrickxia sp.]